jgi:small-conductance mechanosensitive channel
MRRPASRFVHRLALLLALTATAVAAQEAPGSAGESGPPARTAFVGESTVDSAPVVVDGRKLFIVAGVTAFPAAKRAGIIADAIRDLAADPAFDPATISVEEGERDTRFLARGRRLFRFTDTDAEIEGVDRRILVELYLNVIRSTIVDYRAARTREALAASAWQAGIATGVALVALGLLVIGIRMLDRRLERRFRDRVRAVKISSFELVRAERLWGFVRGAVRLVGGFLWLAGAYIYLRYVLGLLPWTRGAAAHLDDWVLAPLSVLGRGLVEKIPDLIFLLVLFLVIRYILRLVYHFFAAVGRGEVELRSFDPDWAEPTYKLVRLGIVAFGLIVAYPYIPGSDSAAFKGVSIFLGVVFSLGSSTTVANILAGYSLTYRRAFREGDRVKIAGILGDVTYVRLQATHLRTIKNEEVVVPNSTILGGEVVNYTTLARSEGLILHTTVGIGYETPWRQVEAMLLEAARRTPGLRAEPKPFVLHLALGDFAVTYEINVACEDPRAMGVVYTDLHRNILDVFNEYGVQIMTPAYEGDPEVPKVVPRDQWHLPPAAKP